jgi:acyl-CoA thioester hydrolase
MYVTETQVRVRYAETDQMGFVYYGNYPAYYEVGRTEALRQLGTSYHALEEAGIMMPVIDMKVNYFRPGRYDELLTVRTTVAEVPKTRMHFLYEIFNPQGELINKGETTLIFLSKDRNRPVRCPQWLQDVFEKAIGDKPESKQ